LPSISRKQHSNSTLAPSSGGDDGSSASLIGKGL
jgi:hypothetical protein